MSTWAGGVGVKVTVGLLAVAEGLAVFVVVGLLVGRPPVQELEGEALLRGTMAVVTTKSAALSSVSSQPSLLRAALVVLLRWPVGPLPSQSWTLGMSP